MDLFLIRHAKHEGDLRNEQGRFVDPGLNALGHRQAQALAEWMKRKLPKLDAVYASTLPRAQETGAYLGHLFDLPVYGADAVREISCNRLDHSPWPKDEIPARSHDVTVFAQPFSPVSSEVGQEAGIHVQARVGLFIEMLLQTHQHEVVAVISHGGIIDVWLSLIFNCGPVRPFKVFISNTGLAHLTYQAAEKPSPWSVFYLNRLDHLRQHDIEETL